MEDLKALDELMLRAKDVEHNKQQEDEQEAQAVRDSYAPQLRDLRRAEALLVENLPEAKLLERYVEKFPWRMVREQGQPADITDLLSELRRCSSALSHVRKTIEKIESFSAPDIQKRWRPARDVSATVATAGQMTQTLGAIKRLLEYWGNRLAEKLPPIEGQSEAIEGNAPPDAGPDIKVLSNYR